MSFSKKSKSFWKFWQKSDKVKSDLSNEKSFIFSIINDYIEYNDPISIANEFSKFFSTFSSNSPLDVNDSLKKIDLMFLEMKREQYLITPMNTDDIDKLNKF